MARAGLPYYSCNFFLRQRFGRRVQKVSIDAGFTCPNVDGTVATGGCTFCDNRSFSPSRRLPRAGIRGQIDQSIERMRLRYRKCNDFLAYFQPATNTYAPVERLRPFMKKRSRIRRSSDWRLARGPIACRMMCSILLGQRFAQLARTLSVEYGMQTIHDRSLDWMNRGHHHDAMLDAIERSRGRGFEIGAHAILGLPGESHDDMLATARELGRLGIDAVKIHNLYCVKNTPLADQVARGEVRLMERAEYVRTLVDFIELLPPTMIVDRISGDAPPDYFIGPTWCLDKPAVRTQCWPSSRRGTWQGKRAESHCGSVGRRSVLNDMVSPRCRHALILAHTCMLGCTRPVGWEATGL